MDYPNITPNSENVSLNKKAFIFFSEIFDTIIKGLIIVLIILFFFLNVCTVLGSSMYPTLENGEILLISNLFYSPKENDIVVFHDTKSLNEPVIKRVIATSNKWVKIDYDAQLLYVSSDNVFDESDIVDESLHAYFDTGLYDETGTYETFVPEGYIFVMGDNRNNSTDSRSSLIGLVDKRTILGKAFIRVSPFSKFGFIH